jgi:hypothetical protein
MVCAGGEQDLLLAGPGVTNERRHGKDARQLIVIGRLTSVHAPS